MIQWKDEYNIGVKLVDEQHKRLFEIAGLAEQLLILPNETDKFDEIVHIIYELKDYVVFHFNAEQSILQNIKFPKYFSHLVMHNDFIENMNSVNIDKIDDDQQKNLLKILNFIMDWIKEHVLIEDRIWAKYYHEVAEKNNS